MAADQPDVSVIVVNYRSAELTVRALQAARDSAGGLALQEIVVDNGSSENELQRLRCDAAQAEVIGLEENMGFAAGNNAGIERAHGRYLLFLNPDAFARGNALAQLVEHLESEPTAGLVAPVLENEDGSIQANLYKRFPTFLTLFVEFCYPLASIAVLLRTRLADATRHPSSWLPIAHAIGAVLLVRAEAARTTGPLDERFFLYLEETEWQRRMASRGWRRDGVRTARFLHLGGGSSGTHALASPHYLDSAALYFGHGSAAEGAIALAAVISWCWLKAFAVLGRSSKPKQDLRLAFAQLLRLLATRRIARLSSPGLAERA